MTIILPQNSQGKRNFLYSLQVHFLKNNARSTKKELLLGINTTNNEFLAVF